MLLAELVECSRAVADAPGRLDKVGRLADLLRRAGPAEIEVVVGFLSGEPRQGRVGVGPAVFRALDPPAAPAATLTLLEVDASLDRLAALSGSGSGRRRAALVGELLARATAPEQDFLVRLLVGELRQGALEGVMEDAVARAAGVPAAAVRRAHMLAGELRAVAVAALTGGRAALDRFSIRLFQPVKPMLAQTAEDVGEALGGGGAPDQKAFEYKLDGGRIQVHRAGDEVRVFTRRLNDVTGALPEVVEVARALPVRSVVLDGEALAFDAKGQPLPFQDTMRRFGRKQGVEALRAELPLSSYYFDCLYLDGEPLLGRSGRDRFAALAEALPEGLVIPRLITADPAEAEAFLRAAVDAGHEGVMAKDLDAPYDAGRRGRRWLKVKPSHTLDLVVLAAEWGNGRRQGWLSNLHLGARDPEAGGFVMLGKTFKGLTDELLAWQTRALLEREIGRDGHTVYVRPELVVEIAFDDVQTSPRYPGGLALRFARVKRYRPDKAAADADSIEAVVAIHAASRGG